MNPGFGPNLDVTVFVRAKGVVTTPCAGVEEGLVLESHPSTAIGRNGKIELDRIVRAVARVFRYRAVVVVAGPPSCVSARRAKTKYKFLGRVQYHYRIVQRFYLPIGIFAALGLLV